MTELSSAIRNCPDASVSSTRRADATLPAVRSPDATFGSSHQFVWRLAKQRGYLALSPPRTQRWASVWREPLWQGLGHSTQKSLPPGSASSSARTVGLSVTLVLLLIRTISGDLRRCSVDPSFVIMSRAAGKSRVRALAKTLGATGSRPETPRRLEPQVRRPPMQRAPHTTASFAPWSPERATISVDYW